MLITVSRVKKPKPAGVYKPVMELAIGGWLGEKFDSKGWAGTTIPLPFCVIVLYWIGNISKTVSPFTRIHESVHIFQDQSNLCFLVTWAKYFYELIKNRFKTDSWFQAYLNNKYEQQAYLEEDQVYYGEKPMPDWAK